MESAAIYAFTSSGIFTLKWDTNFDIVGYRAKAWQVFIQNKKQAISYCIIDWVYVNFVSETIRSKIRLNTAKKEIAQLFSKDFKNSIRGAIWNFGLQTIKESPWIGHGNGDEFQLLNKDSIKVQLKKSDIDSLANGASGHSYDE